MESNRITRALSSLKVISYYRKKKSIFYKDSFSLCLCKIMQKEGYLLSYYFKNDKYIEALFKNYRKGNKRTRLQGFFQLIQILFDHQISRVRFSGFFKEMPGLFLILTNKMNMRQV